MRKMTEAQIKESEALMAWEGNLTIKKGNEKQIKKESEALKENDTFSLPKGSSKTLFSTKAGRRK